MVVTLKLNPEVERRIVSQAAARGISLEIYLKSVIQSAALLAP